MRIFLSWSGETSRQYAEEFRAWLRLVFQSVDLFLSEKDIHAGDRWMQKIADELNTCQFGVAFLTRENLNAPWLHFEAGALAKSLAKGKLVPLLFDLDVRDVTGPLSQFQAKRATRDGFGDLLETINSSLQSPRKLDELKALFEHLWPILEEKFNAVVKTPSHEVKKRSTDEILEELVVSVRTIEREMILDELTFDVPRDPHENLTAAQRYNEFLAIPNLAHSDPMRLVIVADLFSREIGWPFDFALRAKEAIASSRLETAMQILTELLQYLGYAHESAKTRVGICNPAILAILYRTSLELLDGIKGQLLPGPRLG